MQFFILFNALIFQINGSPMQTVRSLLVFGNAETLVQQQQQLLASHSAGVNERDIIVQVIKPGNSLYKQFHVADSTRFTVILVGKDGGEKYRSAEPITTASLFGLIDAMPMRRAEMKLQKRSKP